MHERSEFRAKSLCGVRNRGGGVLVAQRLVLSIAAFEGKHGKLHERIAVFGAVDALNLLCRSTSLGNVIHRIHLPQKKWKVRCKHLVAVVHSRQTTSREVYTRCFQY